MKTLVIIEVEHRKPMPELANMIAGRAWSIDGVTKAEVSRGLTCERLLQVMGAA